MIPLQQIPQIKIGDTIFSIFTFGTTTTFYLEKIEDINENTNEEITTSGVHININKAEISSVHSESFSLKSIFVTPMYSAFATCEVTEENLCALVKQIQIDRPELFI